MRVFALYNIKGGVGKTSAAVNLAYLSALAGIPTLLWDLDPQGAATYCFRIKPKVKGGRRALISGKRPLDDAIKASDFDGLDVLPADFSFRNMDLSLYETKKPERRFDKLLRPMADEYEHVFLDCPPGITLASESVFGAADELLMPIIPATLSMRMLDEVDRFLARRKVKGLKRRAFFNMVDRRKGLHRDLVEANIGSNGFLRATIPYAAVVERLPEERAPLPVFAPRSAAALAYAALWSEIAGLAE